MSQRRIRYEKFLLPALALSAACHLLAALVPASAVDYILRRDTQQRQTVRLEVVELLEEPLLVIKTIPPLPAAIPEFGIAGSPPLPKIRESESRQLATVDIGAAYPATQAGPEVIPVTPSPPLAAPDSVANIQLYMSGVLARIEQARRYPESARRMGHEGSVQVSFAIGRDGGLQQPARLIEPSQFGSLNRAACNSVQRSTPFPPLPDCIQSDSLDVTVRIEFLLR